MAYQNLTLRSIAGEITATYNDNNLRRGLEEPQVSGPSVFLTGTSKSGFKNEPFLVIDEASAMAEFDSRSELARLVQASKEVVRSTPLKVTRIGAKPFHFVIEQQIDGFKEKETILKITPGSIQEADSAERIRSTFESLELVLMPFKEGNLVKQRVLLKAKPVNQGNSVIVYDSERKFVVSGDVAFDVEINVPFGSFLYTPNYFESSVQLPATNVTMSQIDALSEVTAFLDSDTIALSDSEADLLAEVSIVDTSALTSLSLAAYNTANSGKPFSLDAIAGSNAEHIDHLQRYAGNEEAYEKLEFENVDFIYCEKCFADIKPVSLSSSMSISEAVSWGQKSLGYFWKYQFNGRPYMMFFGRQDPFASANVDGYTHDGITYVLNDNQKSAGDLLNLVEFHLYAKASGFITTVESFINKKGIIECHVNFAHDLVRNDSAVGGIETPFAKLEFLDTKFGANDTLVRRLRPSVIGGARTVSDWALDNPTQVNNDPFVISHFDLVGGLVPEAVIERLFTFDSTANTLALVAKAAEVREVSFLHQAAQAAYTASTNYSQTIALVPTTPPPSSFNGISAWAGNPASYEIQGDGTIAVTANGSGVLGTKLLAGEVGYRDSAAFGGIILTNGDSLPNKIPYGIDDSDEALDGFGNPIDLGKHAIVIGAYGLMGDPKDIYRQKKISLKVPSTSSVHFSNAAPKIAAMLANLVPGTEPIGPVRGRVPGFATQQRTPKAVLNNLAALRVCMIDQTGVISSMYTSALRTSDYSKVSSVMSANAIVGRLRSECLPIIGSAFNDATIQSLQTRISGLEKQMVQLGYCQSIRTRLSASRIDRINGVLNMSVTFVPPLSIEAITINVTLEPPQSGI